MSTLNMEWKQQLAKRASQVTSNADMEKIFFEQAYTFIQNTAEPLMTPSFRIGFEIVYRNENDTKMVGLFVFRIGKNLLYAPVFYINGSIKGTELLYRTDSKSIVLLDPDWCDWLIRHYSAPSGESVERNGAHRRQGGQVRFDRMISPGGAYKQGAVAAWEEMVEAADTALANHADTVKSAGETLKACLTDLGPDALMLVKNAAEREYSFDNALFLNFALDQYMPEAALAVREKQASVNNLLVVHTVPALNPLVKEASTTELQAGYRLEDNRPETEKCAVVVVGQEQEFGVLGSGQSGDVILADGSFSPASLVDHDRGYLDRLHDRCCGNMSPVLPSYEYEDAKSTLLLGDSGKFTYLRCSGRHAPYIIEGTSKPVDLSKAGSEPEVGKAYLLYDAETSTVLSDAFFVTAIEGNRLTVSGNTYYNPADIPYSAVVMYRNPKAKEGDLESGILGKNIKFLELVLENEGSGGDVRIKRLADNVLADLSDINRELFNDSFNEVTLRRSSHSYDISIPGRKRRSFVSKSGAAIFSAAAFGMDEATANDLVGRFEDGKEKTVYIKTASQLYWDEVPSFTDSFDPTFGVGVDNPQSMVVRAETPDIEEEVPRVGDINKVETGMDLDAIGGPAELDNFAKRVGMRQIFEHGVIGSLLKEFDAASVIDKYMPDLEKGLDRLGRLLFLVYWKPSDFGQLFGADDISAMEQSIQGTFKQQGRLLLDLLQKPRKPKTSLSDA